jgi:two-component system, NtrC family, sensor kinase
VASHRFDSLTFRLTGTLIVALALLLAVTAMVQIGLQGRFSREYSRINGLAMSETILAGLHSRMLANDRAGLHAVVRQITERTPTVRIRIFNKEGLIMFSSTEGEVGTKVDPRAEACYKCHASGRPIERLPPGERTRSFTLNGQPAIGIIKPIENEAVCSSGACHAHPASRRLLGVLDVSLTLASASRAQRQTEMLMAGTTGAALLLVVGVVVVVVRRAVDRPVRGLTRTLDALGGGDYTARYEDREIAEFSHLGDALNRTAAQLERANSELLGWAQTLERRVEEKAAALSRAQEQMIRVERMASLGKLAAVVAHEINNPLASVVTYSKLLLRRFRDHPRDEEEWRATTQTLAAIADESVRCGEIVSNLLLFARRTGSRFEPTDLDEIISKTTFLIKHKMDLAQVTLDLRLASDPVPVLCDPAQIEQALLALCMNAIEAMPGGGVLTVRTSYPEGRRAVIELEDSGIGIDAEVLGHIFEPFFTTRSEGESKGLGLGLAVVYGIVQRHSGTIEVDTTPGRGTRMIVTLPVAGEKPAEEE